MMFPDKYGSDLDHAEAIGNGHEDTAPGPSPILPPEEIAARLARIPVEWRPVFLRLYEGRA